MVIERSDIPPLYNPNYFDKSVMEKYLPVLPQKIAASVIFRIDNILLKKDYPDNWWSGTDNPEAIEYLEKIKKNILKIKRKLEIKGKNFKCDKNIEKLSQI